MGKKKTSKKASTQDPTELLEHPKLMALAPQHLAFVLHLLGPKARFNATKAAELAEFKADNRRSLASMASAVLGRDDVQAAIKVLCGPLAMGAGQVLAALAMEATDRDNSARDRIKALELLGKNLGLWKERIEHSGQVELGSFEELLAALVSKHYGQ